MTPFGLRQVTSRRRRPVRRSSSRRYASRSPAVSENRSPSIDDVERGPVREVGELRDAEGVRGEHAVGERRRPVARVALLEAPARGEPAVADRERRLVRVEAGRRRTASSTMRHWSASAMPRGSRVMNGAPGRDAGPGVSSLVGRPDRRPRRRAPGQSPEVPRSPDTRPRRDAAWVTKTAPERRRRASRRPPGPPASRAGPHRGFHPQRRPVHVGARRSRRRCRVAGDLRRSRTGGGLASCPGVE